MRPKATAPFDGMIFNMSGSPYAMQEKVRPPAAAAPLSLVGPAVAHAARGRPT